jgi:hypothetical protein
MPISKKKPKSFTFTLSEMEYATLFGLAAAENRSMANYLRHLIDKERKRTYGKRKAGC